MKANTSALQDQGQHFSAARAHTMNQLVQGGHWKGCASKSPLNRSAHRTSESNSWRARPVETPPTMCASSHTQGRRRARWPHRWTSRAALGCSLSCAGQGLNKLRRRLELNLCRATEAGDAGSPRRAARRYWCPRPASLVRAAQLCGLPRGGRHCLRMPLPKTGSKEETWAGEQASGDTGQSEAIGEG